MAHIVGIETRGRDVLAALDQRVPTSFCKNHSVEEVAQIFEQEAQGGQGASGPLTRGAAAA